MNYRLSTIYPRKSFTADETIIIDLNLIDPVSQFIIELAANVTNDEAITAHAIACLEKIELVDGSDVLFSLSGYEAEAVDWYCNHNQNSPWDIYMGWGETQRFIRLNFGRFLWDPLFAFNPMKFKNPQLKLTLNINAGGAVPTLNRLQVWGALFDEKKIEPTGFLMHKEIKDYLVGVSSHEYTDLPTDYPYRKLFVRCQEKGTEPNQNIDNIKLSEDQDKRVVMNHGTEDIFRTIAMQSPPIEEHIHARVATALTTIYCTPTTRCHVVAAEDGATSGSGAIATSSQAGGYFKAIAATAQKYAQFFVRGWLPHGTWEIPFGLQDDPTDWYDVTKVGSLKADILASAGVAGTEHVQLFLQQLRKY